VQLEGNRQPVSRRPRQPRRVLQGRQIEGCSCEGTKNHNPFVNDTDTAYTVH